MKYHMHLFDAVVIWAELKVCRGKSLPFSSVKEKQWRNLVNAETNFMYHKFSDMAQLGTPCDAVYSKPRTDMPVRGIIVVQYLRSGYFYIIPVTTWVEESMFSSRSSLTEERAHQIGTRYELGKIVSNTF